MAHGNFTRGSSTSEAIPGLRLALRPEDTVPSVMKFRFTASFCSVAVVASAFSLLLGPASAAMETWTAADGQRTLRGEIVSVEGDQVTMRLENGSTQTFALTMLAAADQQRAREAAPAAASVLQQELVGKLQKLDDDKLDDTELTKTPEFFILYYSASWCPPCRATAPHSVEFYNEMVKDNPKVELIMVSADDDEDACEEWAAEVGMPWAILPKDEREDVAAVHANAPRGIPTMVLVDGDGKALASGRAEQMRAALEKL